MVLFNGKMELSISDNLSRITYLVRERSVTITNKFMRGLLLITKPVAMDNRANRMISFTKGSG